MWNINNNKKDTNELTYKTEVELQMKTNMISRDKRGGRVNSKIGTDIHITIYNIDNTEIYRIALGTLLNTL